MHNEPWYWLWLYLRGSVLCSNLVDDAINTVSLEARFEASITGYARGSISAILEPNLR
jgi:hypothetical protein